MRFERQNIILEFAMIARSVWRVERTIPEKKVPPRAELTIEGATA
jgi:hypothetical protein